MKSKSAQGSRIQQASVKPMLCTLIKQPFNDPNYIHEVKWDGYRIVGYKRGNHVRLESRGGEDYTKKYPAIAKALASIGSDFTVDGEVVYINNKGKPDFDSLQKVNGQIAPIIYYVFDILFLNDQNLMSLPWIERRKVLNETIATGPVVRVSDSFDDGVELYEHAKKLGLEGIVSKDKTSQYVPDQRGKKWYKVPIEQKREYVIGGWVESEKRDTFRTLLFGEYDGSGNLRWVGHAGGGYKEHEMPNILAQLKSIEVSKSPFVNEVDYSEGKPHWVKPELVANIKYSTFTKSGKIRKPAIFQGFRNDKSALQVVTQLSKDHIQRSKSSKSSSPDSNWPELEKIAVKSVGTLDVDEYKLEIHNIEKDLWKGVTKADLIAYYNSVAKYILPHVENRPLSLHIKHQGINAPGLYIKDMEERQPIFADIYSTQRKLKKEGKRDVIDYLVCNNRATLLYVIDLGCIDLNPWTSTVKDPMHPSYVVIDLDPSDEDFAKAISVALAAKEVFDKLKLKSFLKTSGKTGLHLVLPCRELTFHQCRAIAEQICIKINKLVPDISTTNITIADRGTRLYLDPNQNDYSDTLAAPYCLRPYKHPNVSTPLDWNEVKTGLTPEDFTTKEIIRRLQKKGDLFAKVFDEKIAAKNTEILKQL